MNRKLPWKWKLANEKKMETIIALDTSLYTHLNNDSRSGLGHRCQKKTLNAVRVWKIDIDFIVRMTKFIFCSRYR